MACSQLTGSLKLDVCSPSVGGVKKVYLANYMENAAQISTTEGATNTMVTGFTTGITWYDFSCRKNTASMTSTLNVSDNGTTSVSTVLSLAYAQMSADKRIAMVALAKGELMAVVEDSNGHYWFLGKDNPVTSTAGTGETGTAKTDANQYTAELTDDSLEYPYEVSASVAEGLVKAE